jgi:hypothetical protein
MNPQNMINASIFPLWMALVLITLFAMDRFSTPSENRASTTAVRYYSAAFTYIGIYWIAFFVIKKYPVFINLVSNNMEMGNGAALPQWMTESPSTLVVAILLSILLPKIPLLSDLDAKLKTLLQKMADIPYETRRFSKEIHAAPFSMPEHLRQGLHDRLASRGFDQNEIAIEGGEPAKQLWTKISILLLGLESWEADAGFSAFIHERHFQYQRIKKRYRRLIQMAKSCFDLMHEAPAAVADDGMARAAAKFHASFMSEADDLLGNICDFISQGVLKCRLTHNTRITAMARIGFQLNREDRAHVLNPNRVIGFFGFLLLLLMFNFIIWSPGEKEAEALLIKVTMIVSIFASAVICGIFPKEKWVFFQKGASGQLPVAGYFLSGLLAAVSSMLISIGFKTLIYLKGDPTLSQAIHMAWVNFSTQSYPFILMAFSTAALTGYQIDLKLPGQWSDRLQRIAHGTIQAMVTMATALLVYWWLQSLRENPPPLLMLVQCSAVLGFAIGYIVPCWYWRGSGQRQEAQWSIGEEEMHLTPAGG